MLYEKTGLTRHDTERATPGFTLFSPLFLRKTFLINMAGKVVHEWILPGAPGNYAYLLPSGNLLAAIHTDEGPKGLNAKGGRLIELDWQGNIVWEYIDHAQHHDFRRLANGNTAYLGWELWSEETSARVGGGRAGTEHHGRIFGDYIREVDSNGSTAWEWHAQTEMEIEKYPLCTICSRAEYAHPNAICPMPDGGYMVSWRTNHLIAWIDRETRKFKWEMMDMQFGHQHDVQLLDNGNITLFANGEHTGSGGPRTGSRILEIELASKKTVWEFKTTPPHLFFSPYISGAQRLPSGNTLICEGLWGRIFEVTPAGEMVWNFINPFFVPNDAKQGPGTNSVFRAYRYTADSPEIRGRLGSAQ